MMKSNKNFEAPRLDVIKFNATDVIATSGVTTTTENYKKENTVVPSTPDMGVL